MSGEITIVLAWAEDGLENTGEPYAADMGVRAPTRPVKVPKAAVWTLRGSYGDVERAQALAAEINRDPSEPRRHVLTYPVSEADPLGRAKRDVLEVAS